MFPNKKNVYIYFSLCIYIFIENIPTCTSAIYIFSNKKKLPFWFSVRHRRCNAVRTVGCWMAGDDGAGWLFRSAQLGAMMSRFCCCRPWAELRQTAMVEGRGGWLLQWLVALRRSEVAVGSGVHRRSCFLSVAAPFPGNGNMFWWRWKLFRLLIGFQSNCWENFQV